MEACLARIPAETPEVAPLVQIVAALQSLAGPVPEMDAQARQQLRSRFLVHARALAEPSPVTIEESLDESIGKLADGASIDECLDEYPHHAAELLLLLTTVADLQSVGNVRSKWEAGAAIDARQGFLARATVLRTRPEVSIEDALDASIQMIAAGASIETCLETFPGHSVELRALLVPVSIAQRPWQPAPKQPRNVVLSRRRDFLTAAAALRSASVVTAPVESHSVAPPAIPASRRPDRPAAPPPPPWWQDWTVAFRQPAWRFAFVAVLLLILALGFGRTAVTLASDALPGDALYPVKRLTERTRMVLTVNPQERVKLEEDLDQVRLMEVKQVVAQGRQEPVEIPGVIGFITGDTWSIVGLDSPVIVPKGIVKGRVPRVGNRVLITALPDSQGRLVASGIVVLKDRPIRSVPDDTPTPSTQPTRHRATEEPNSGAIPVRPTRPRPTPTDVVWPTATAPALFTATATFMPSVIGSPTPIATLTGTPVSTDTSTPPLFGTPTSIPEPTGTVTGTQVPSTSTPGTSITETSTPEPQPTSTPEPQPTSTPEPQPTSTPEPQPTSTPEPQPTSTPEPQPTSTPEPQPTSTPEPQPTSTPEPQPTSTPEPQPTATSEPPASTPEPPPTATSEPPTMLVRLAQPQHSVANLLVSTLLSGHTVAHPGCFPVSLILPQRWLGLCDAQTGRVPVSSPFLIF